jgi:hypothetical protein
VPTFEIPAETTATTFADGIRLTIELDRVPLMPGVESWATMTVTNEGADTLRYGVDGCDIPIFAQPVPSGFLLEGGSQERPAAAFKADALRDVGLPAAGRFTAEHLIGRDVACADYYMPKRIEPGRSIRQRALWEPAADGMTPDFPVEIVASYRYEWRGEGEGPERDPVITATLSSAVIGGMPWPWLTPAEALDVALDDPEFAAWVADVPTGQPPWSAEVQFDTEAQTWVVQAFRELPVGWIAQLTIDATTGEIIGRRFD